VSVLTVPRARPLLTHLASYGECPALVGDGFAVSYADLADRVGQVAATLGATRRLVLVEGAQTVDAVASYLGALAGGHVVLLSGDAAVDSLALAYRPDVVISGAELTEVRAGTAHDLHPDLALLLSTSGSTGSPKLVRLSHDNLIANARAIAAYLELRPSDRAATTLPLHYCYGLSVLHSHLSVGASLLLTDRSVLEPEFWQEFRDHGATSFAGVPHTFELLDRVGFADLDLPTLRYVTQAGGKLAPADVRRHAELGLRRGYDLYVMYGQTEATARMAYLPPALAVQSPEAIGVPIPGGSFHLEPLPERPLAKAAEDTVAVGELVYDGPNVMLGYAESPADLALGRIVDGLRTGDVARLRTDGLYEVIGRRSRITKVFGLRIDLDHVERVLAGQGVIAAAADGGDHLVLAVCDGARPVQVADVLVLVRTAFGLPAAGVHVSTWTEIPRLPSGKTDYRRIAEPVSTSAGGVSTSSTDAGRAGRAGRDQILELYADLLGRSDVRPTDSFVSLGGDSLSYVEVSLRLERMLGHLPAQWHTLPVAALVDAPRERPRRGRQVEVNVLMRAIAIVTVVSAHAGWLTLLGGAHVLLAAVGFNFARFQLAGEPGRRRSIGMLRAVARIAVPSSIAIALVAAFLQPRLGWQQILLFNQFRPHFWTGPDWHYWFIESIVAILLLCTALLAVPPIARLDRRHPFWFPVALTLVALPIRSALAGVAGGDDVHRSWLVLWLFTLGWAAARARSRRERIVVSLLTFAALPGFFHDPARAAYVAVGVLALVWLPSVRVPRPVATLAGVLAGASLWIYLLHFEVIHRVHPAPVSTAAGLAVGVVVHLGVTRASRPLGNGLRRARS